MLSNSTVWDIPFSNPITEQEAKQVNRYLDVTAPCETADLLFVFGNSLTLPAQMAVEILLDERVRYVVLTGGFHKRTGINEAQAHEQILLDCGVPQDRIIMENESTNTRENVIFALPQMMKCLDMD